MYGLACDPEDRAAIDRLYALKGRPPTKPAAIMYFSFDALPPLPPRAERLLPGPVTLLIPTPDGGVQGIRFPDVPLTGPPVLQSSANHSGKPDARTLDEVPPDIRDAVDLVIDGGPLPGTPSTVVDLTVDPHRIVRDGALPAAEVARRLTA